MATVLEYLEDTYRLVSQGQLLRVSNDDRGQFAVLDKTIFYPQGGGQPADQGFLEADEKQIMVTAVRFFEGEVFHYGNFSEVATNLNATISLHVNEATRSVHARLHTGGHLVANLVEMQSKNLIATKGYHFQDGAYVEFESQTSTEDFSYDCAALNECIRNSINADFPVTAYLTSLPELQQICPHIPANLPTDKPLRVVRIGEMLPIPCGGTHIRSLRELGSLTVTKASRKKGNIRFSYELA